MMDRKKPQDRPGRNFSSLWPPIANAEGAVRASRHGFWAAVINMPLTLALLVAAALGGRFRGRDLTMDLAYLNGAELLLFIPIIWGLWRHSPAAAVAALVVYLASEILAWTWLDQPPDLFSFIVIALFVIFFIHGIRGTLALRALGQGTPPT